MGDRKIRALGMALTPPAVEHRVRLLQRLQPGELFIHEIYRSIQGESTFAGLPCVFVRLTGCDLRCVWCDTPHAFTQGQILHREQVVRQVLDYNCPLVEITGGEPLLQQEVYPLMEELADAGCTILLETSGAHDISAVDPRVHVIMDLKCPDSGECERNYWPNLAILKPTDQIKFVVASRRDWDWVEQTIRQYHLQERFVCLVSPAFGRVTPLEVVTWLLESKLQRVRFQLQLHKYVWDPATRGV